MSNKKLFAGGMLLGFLAGAVGGVAAYKKSKKMKFRVWMWKVKTEIYRNLNKLKSPTQADFEDTVDRAIEKYRALEGMTKDEVAEISEGLKKKWKYVKKRFQEEVKRKKDEAEESKDDEDEDEE